MAPHGGVHKKCRNLDGISGCDKSGHVQRLRNAAQASRQPEPWFVMESDGLNGVLDSLTGSSDTGSWEARRAPPALSGLSRPRRGSELMAGEGGGS